MSAYDIWPVADQPSNVGVRFAPLNASETFRQGEVVLVNDDGELATAPKDSSALALGDADGGCLMGVAAASGDTGGTGNNVVTAGTLIPYWPFGEGIIFRTKNVSNGSGTVAIPSGALVGENLTLEADLGTNTRWGIATGAGTIGTHAVVQVLAVRDANGNPIGPTDTANGVYVDFTVHIG